MSEKFPTKENDLSNLKSEIEESNEIKTSSPEEKTTLDQAKAKIVRADIDLEKNKAQSFPESEFKKYAVNSVNLALGQMKEIEEKARKDGYTESYLSDHSPAELKKLLADSERKGDDKNYITVEKVLASKNAKFSAEKKKLSANAFGEIPKGKEFFGKDFDKKINDQLKEAQSNLSKKIDNKFTKTSKPEDSEEVKKWKKERGANGISTYSDAEGNSLTKEEFDTLNETNNKKEADMDSVNDMVGILKKGNEKVKKELGKEETIDKKNTYKDAKHDLESVQKDHESKNKNGIYISHPEKDKLKKAQEKYDQALEKEGLDKNLEKKLAKFEKEKTQTYFNRRAEEFKEKNPKLAKGWKKFTAWKSRNPYAYRAISFAVIGGAGAAFAASGGGLIAAGAYLGNKAVRMAGGAASALVGKHVGGMVHEAGWSGKYKKQKQELENFESLLASKSEMNDSVKELYRARLEKARGKVDENKAYKKNMFKAGGAMLGAGGFMAGMYIDSLSGIEDGSDANGVEDNKDIIPDNKEDVVPVTPNPDKPETFPITPEMPETEISGDIFIHKGEGITHAYLRQLEASQDLRDHFGITGTPTGADSMRVAQELGYIDSSGEVRVNFGKGAGYEIKLVDVEKLDAEGSAIMGENGKPIIEQKATSFEHYGGSVDSSGHYVGGQIHEVKRSDLISGLEQDIEDRSTPQNYEYKTGRGAIETNTPKIDDNFVIKEKISGVGTLEYADIDTNYIIKETPVIPESNYVFREPTVGDIYTGPSQAELELELEKEKFKFEQDKFRAEQLRIINEEKILAYEKKIALDREALEPKKKSWFGRHWAWVTGAFVLGADLVEGNGIDAFGIGKSGSTIIEATNKHEFGGNGTF
jgi:hypothetical protein